ncbi:hypothetical protein [uncultured Roseobacter sp.]|uniref:hypothetical protein n=1 Tax=uncultured Roseobacter sp. TaxID=114847 RepID=UPI0026044D22|nr:hypothetical protein [uncultured Roseobacter sp.]
MTGIASFGSIVVIERASNTERIAENFCFERDDQPSVAVFFDNSFPQDMDATQERDYIRALDEMYGQAEVNTRFAFFSTSTGHAGSIARPFAEICKTARTPEELEEIGAPVQTAQRTRVIYGEAEDAWTVQVQELMQIAKDGSRAAKHSPILETIQSITRYPAFAQGPSSLKVYTDGLQNSEIAQFCIKKGHMPSYAKFQAKATFDAVRPETLSGVDVEMFLVELGQMPSDELPYCSNDEMRTWWQDYFTGNEAASAQITRLRHWGQ